MVVSIIKATPIKTPKTGNPYTLTGIPNEVPLTLGNPHRDPKRADATALGV